MNTKSSRLALAAAALTLAPAQSFSQSANDGFDPNPNGGVWALALQPDGKVLVGGAFTTVGGTGSARIARLDVDGNLDTTFKLGYYVRNPGADGIVSSLAVQPDGKILVGGPFNTLGAQTRYSCGRLNADGSVDTAFDPQPNGTVWSLVLQADGKIVIGGGFTAVGGEPRENIARLNTDGSLDTAFHPGTDLEVYCLAIQADGKILVGGIFSKLDDKTRNNLGRLNTDGSLDATFNPKVDGATRSLAVQPDGKILVGAWFKGEEERKSDNIGRLNPDGSLDTAFNPGVEWEVTALARQSDGKILFGGRFAAVNGQDREHIGRLYPDGSLDATFNPGASLASCPGCALVRTLAVQTDGKILVGGDFTTLGGTNRNYLGRLYPDGSLDATLAVASDFTAWAPAFSPALEPDGSILVVGGVTMHFNGAVRHGIARLRPDGSLDPSLDLWPNNHIEAVAVQADGKIVVGGHFGGFYSCGQSNWFQPYPHLARINSDGKLDASFNPGANAPVYSIAIQADGKILAGGGFTNLLLLGQQVGQQSRNHICRLNADGTLDMAFDPGANTDVLSLAVQADGRILVAGTFTALGGEPHSGIGRLNADGSVDTAFNPSVNDWVYCVAVDPDGKILIGGLFTVLNGKTHNRIGRLNADGTLDSTFDPIANGWVLGFALQTDGRILLGGSFSTLNDLPRSSLGRLDADGTVDPLFNPGSSSQVLGMAVQTDGKILVAGGVTLGGQLRGGFGRLASGSAAVQALAINGSGTIVTWMRSGSAPEIEQVTFEQSSDGTNYSPLGRGTRIAGGWKLDGLSLAAGENFYLRARGRASGGSLNSASGLIESVAQFYLIPLSHITSFGKLGSGAFQFAFPNPTGASYTVLAATNVASPTTNWEVLGAPVPAGNNVYQFTDPGATNHPQRFYQLRAP